MLTLQQSNSSAKQTTLSLRLSAIAESLPESGVICDVGSDHGALPMYLLSNGKCSSAIVTDLNEKPLERAKENLRDAGVFEKATFVLTDGIEAVLPMKPDAFVIAGMGGETIAGILDRGLSQIPNGTKFVLQPMTKADVLRRFLYKTGFCVQDEKLVYENGKYFLVIQTIYDGVSRSCNEFVCELGEFLPKMKNDVTRAFFASKLTSLSAVIEGKRKAGASCEDDLKKRDYLLKLLEDMDENKRD